MTDKNDPQDELQDRLSELEDEQTDLNALAEEKHVNDTRDAYRAENGEEMDEYDNGNLGDQAAIEAYDEDDAAAAADIDDDLRLSGRRIQTVDGATTSVVISEIMRGLDEIAEKIGERRRRLTGRR